MNISGNKCDSSFSYLRFIDVSAGEQESLHYSLLSRILHLARAQIRAMNQRHHITWRRHGSRASSDGSLNLILPQVQKLNNLSQPNLFFCRRSGAHVGFADVTLHPMPETVEHRRLRASKVYHRPCLNLPPFLQMNLNHLLRGTDQTARGFHCPLQGF